MRRIAIPSFLVVASLLFALPPSIARSQPGRNPLDDRASLALPGMESVQVDTGIVFLEAPGVKLAFDFFHPAAAIDATGRSRSPQGRRAPLVVFVNGVGIADPPLRRWGGYQSWGRLVAMSGMAAVTHDSRRETPREDLEALIAHLRRNAERYGIDPENIAIWASSANLRHGSWYALNPANKHVKAAAFYYGGIDTTYLRGDLPVFVARAGLDFQGTNAGMDGFVARSLARNAPVTVVNLPNGRHGFDVTDPEEASRDVIRSTMAFLRANLSPEMQEARHAREAQRLTVERHAVRDWEGTLAASSGWLATEPDAAQARLLSGDAYYNLRRFREAAEAYQGAGDAGFNRPVTYYNAACAWALAGERERALVHLEKALATGMITNRRAIAQDPDFDSLKDEVRFRRLIETP